MRNLKQMSLPIALWVAALYIFLLVLYYGKFPSIEYDETIYLREFAPKIWQRGGASLVLILSAMALTICLAATIAGFQWGLQRCSVWLSRYLPKKLAKGFFSFLVAVISFLPTVLSAIPLFITGIFLIRYFQPQMDTWQNTIYGVLCLSAFNVNYFSKKSARHIQETYRKPFVMYARSLGLPEKVIFRNYVFPEVWKTHLAILRELLPHLLVESIVIEYTFTSKGLMLSAIQAVVYRNWYYFLLVLCLCGLFIAAFDILCRWIEGLIIPAKGFEYG